MGNPKKENSSDITGENKLDLILKKITEMQKEIAIIPEIEKGMNFLAMQFEEIKKEMEQYKINYKKEIKEKTLIKQQLTDQQAEIRELKNELEAVLIREKSNCAEIKGIPETQGEQINEIIKKIIRKTGPKIMDQNILKGYRIRSKHPNLHLINITFESETSKEELIVSNNDLALN